MRECNCCMKNVKLLTKCFVNSSCNWKSCNNCINKQINLLESNKYIYKCPSCRKDSDFHKHSRFSRYVKQNRGALRRIMQLQNEYINKMTDKLSKIHLIVATNVTGQEQEIYALIN